MAYSTLLPVFRLRMYLRLTQSLVSTHRYWHIQYMNIVMQRFSQRQLSTKTTRNNRQYPQIISNAHSLLFVSFVSSRSKCRETQRTPPTSHTDEQHIL